MLFVLPREYVTRSISVLLVFSLAHCTCLQVPMRTLRLPERRLTSVPANFGYSYVLFLAMVIPKFSVNIGMTSAKMWIYLSARIFYEFKIL